MPSEISDVATFLHREITFAAERTNYQLQYVMTGVVKAGEVYFNGTGGCVKCHSPSGDLNGIGLRYDGPRLQALIAFGTMGGGHGRGEASGPPRTARRATVTLASGETFSGVLLRLTDFDVTIRADDGKPRSWLRSYGDYSGRRYSPLAQINAATVKTLSLAWTRTAAA